jgi:hypothetical protein
VKSELQLAQATTTSGFCKEKGSRNHMELLGIKLAKMVRNYGHWCDCLRLIEWAQAGNLAEGWQFLVLG